MKGKCIRLMVFILIFNVTTASLVYSDYDDVSDDVWYADWVYIVSELNLVKGYDDGTFKPDNDILRIELLSMVLKGLGYDIRISNDYWGQNILDKAVELNIITAQKFDLVYSIPDDVITREEAARVIYNAYLINNSSINSDVTKNIISQLSDIDEVGTLYKSAVIGVLAEGLVSGYEKGGFKPKETLTRAEAAVLITRLLLPEKRVAVDLDIPYYEFESKSVRAKDFKTYFGQAHRDIYNIMTIITYLENKITSQGFAVPKDLTFENTHEINLYTSLNKFDTINQTSDWHILLRKNKVTDIYSGGIEITTSRLNHNTVYDETIRGLFTYLFAEDAERMLGKIDDYRRMEIAEDESYDYETKAFNRNVLMVITPDKIKLLISKVDDVLPVEIQDGQLSVVFKSEYSDGTQADVHYSDTKSGG